ncbi:MAG: HEAT repeat domain-containing protein [Candidatus Hermodarchaeota archaeon]
MSKDLKNLINSVEEEAKSKAELEQTIHSLKEEIKRLEFTINEQNLLIETLKSQIKDEELEQVKLPSEIKVLKDIIVSQRKELEEKDDLIDQLNDKIVQVGTGIESGGDFNLKEELSEKIVNAENLIVQLTDENEQFKSQINQLQQKIEEFQSNEENHEIPLDNELYMRQNEELTNFKKLNFQLMQENGLLRVEIESLKAKLEKSIEEASSEELEKAYDKINALTTELEDYKTQKIYLQDQLNNLNEPVTISTEDALEYAKLREEFDNLKSELVRYQEENKKFKEIISELEKKIEDLESIKIEGISIPQRIPKKIKHTLFNRMYRLLDENNKNKVIDFLIQDLKSKNSETKSNAIKILSQIKNDKIYNAFFEIIDDQDWLVRYNLLKAINQYEDKSDQFKTLLKKLSKDVDVDVRELAVKILSNISE